MDAKTISWLSYITIIGWIIAYINHNNSVVKSSVAAFHLRQSFGLMVLYFAIWIIGMMLMIIPFVGGLIWLLYVGVMILWVIGLINAVNGETKPLPVVGLPFQQWFTFIK